MAKNLNLLYNYRIKKASVYDTDSIKQLKKHPIKTKDCWSRSVYNKVKAQLKADYYLPQNRRCAYCRKRLNADAYFSHIDHVLPKSYHKNWMFKPKNLVLTCEVCNPLKNDCDTLTTGRSKRRFPKKKEGFTIFNPHYSFWKDYFFIEDGMFIRGKNSVADATIKVVKLYQYHYSIQFAEESVVTPKTAIKRATIKMRGYSPGSNDYESAKKVVDYYTRLI